LRGGGTAYNSNEKIQVKPGCSTGHKREGRTARLPSQRLPKKQHLRSRGSTSANATSRFRIEPSSAEEKVRVNSTGVYKRGGFPRDLKMAEYAYSGGADSPRAEVEKRGFTRQAASVEE